MGAEQLGHLVDPIVGHADGDPAGRDEGLANLVEVAVRLDFAVVDHGEVRANPFELGQDVRGDDDGLAESGEFGDQLTQLHPRPRIEPRGRLVEHEELGIVHQRAGQGEALLHAPRQAVDVGVGLVVEVHQRQQIA